jgi:hypothetical protein
MKMEQLATLNIENLDPRFDQINRWTAMMMQVYAARAYLRFLGEYAHPNDFRDMDSIHRHQGYFYCFLSSYWKCFGQSKGKRVLRASEVFSATPEILPIHKRIETLRHEVAAHNGQSGLDLSAIDVVEFDTHFQIKQNYAIALPLHEYDNYKKALTQVEEYVVDELNRSKHSLSRSLGKPIETEES